MRAEAVKWVARQTKIDCTEVYVRKVLNDRNIVSDLALLIREAYKYKINELEEAQKRVPSFLK